MSRRGGVPKLLMSKMTPVTVAASSREASKPRRRSDSAEIADALVKVAFDGIRLPH